MKKPVKKATTTTNPSFRGFVNVNLSDHDKHTIKNQPFTEADFFVWLDKVISDEFKLTFSYDDYNHAYTCIGTRSNKEHVDYGLLLAGRGSTSLKAFKQWLYIRDQIIDDSTWTEFNSAAVPDDLDD